jgi:Transglycosylase
MTTGMRMRAPWRVWPLAMGLALAMSYAALCFGLYEAGARHLPASLAPNPDRAPAAIRAQYLAVEAPTADSLPRLNPLTWLPYVLWNASGDGRPCDACRLLTSTARIASFRDRDAPGNLGRHLTEIAAAIRIGREWTRDEAVDTILAESRFRSDAIGIEAAARFHFGVPASALRPQESLALIALMKAPALLDPSCSPERFSQRYADVVAALGHTGPDWTASAALARFRPQACGQR